MAIVAGALTFEPLRLYLYCTPSTNTPVIITLLAGGTTPIVEDTEIVILGATTVKIAIFPVSVLSPESTEKYRTVVVPVVAKGVVYFFEAVVGVVPSVV